MQEDELNLKTDITISDEYYKSLESEAYNINDLPQLISNINDSDPLIKLKGLFGLGSLLLIETKKENPTQIYNDDINIIFNILENYPEEFKIECFKCLECIEYINYKLEKNIKYEPSEKIMKIMLYILDFPEKVKLELLFYNLKYINILLIKENYFDKFGVEKLYNSIKNIFEIKFSNNKKIIEPTLYILLALIKTKNELVTSEKILEIIPSLEIFLDKFQLEAEIKKVILNILYQLTEVNIDTPLPIKRKIMDKIIGLKMLPKLIDNIDKLDITEQKNQLMHLLRTVGNICAMEDGFYTDKILEFNFLDKLKILIQKKYPFETRKESAWIISNIAAGTSQQLIKLYENNFQDILIDIITNEEDNAIKDNCLWALYNYCNINNFEYLENIVEKGIIDIIMKRLNTDTGDILCCSLEALYKILCEGKKKDPAFFNIIETKINEYDILNDLKSLLKNNEEEMLRNKIEIILHNYYGIDDIQKFLDSNNEDNK